MCVFMQKVWGWTYGYKLRSGSKSLFEPEALIHCIILYDKAKDLIAIVTEPGTKPYEKSGTCCNGSLWTILMNPIWTVMYNVFHAGTKCWQCQYRQLTYNICRAEVVHNAALRGENAMPCFVTPYDVMLNRSDIPLYFTSSPQHSR